MPVRIRHCKCPHVPPREDILDMLSRLTARTTISESHAVADALLGSEPTHLHDRTLRSVSLPNEAGHQYWTGPRPLTGGQVRVMLAGRRMPIALWLWLRAGRPDAGPLVRTCHDPQCIRVEHHALASEPRQQALVLMHRELDAFDARRPKINYRPKRWDNSDPTGAQCLSGHPLRIYGDPKLRNAYCAACAALERKRATDRAALAREIEVLEYLRDHGDIAPDSATAALIADDWAEHPAPVQPTLAQQEANAHNGDATWQPSELTLAEEIERMAAAGEL